MDYFTRTYVSGQPYSSQKSFMRARPQTNVKLMTTNRSQVNYTSTPQGTLRKPYQHDTYNSMPYLFSGYPAVRRNWFDSEVGGQGIGRKKSLAITSDPRDTTKGFTSPTVPLATWSEVRDASIGNSGFVGQQYYQYIRAGATAAVPGPIKFFVDRFLFGFDLRKLQAKKIKNVRMEITGYTTLGTQTSVCVQASSLNPQRYLSLDDYSSFYGPLIAKTSQFHLGKHILIFNKFGINYINRKIGNWAAFCLREYDHDYLDVEPSAGTNYQNTIYSGNHHVKSQRPTLIINY